MGVVFRFEQLVVYQESRTFRKRMYKLAKLLPRYEFKLATQIRDASRSMTNCISEGYGRYTFKDRLHFFRESRASLLELVDDINICVDEAYFKVEHLETLRVDASNLHKRINGYIQYLEEQAKKSAPPKRRRMPMSSEVSGNTAAP